MKMSSGSLASEVWATCSKPTGHVLYAMGATSIVSWVRFGLMQSGMEMPRDSRICAELRIPVMWALDSGDVGRRRSEATLVEFYSIQVAHMSQEKGK